jgi:hypothetical protein
MEIPRSALVAAPAPVSAPAVRFADVARRLGAAAHANGLAVPAFRCPPRTAGVMRTLRRYPGGTVVSVRLRDRPFAAVVTDMVDGVVAANRVAPADADRIRAALRAALDGTLADDEVEGDDGEHDHVTDDLTARAA